MELIAAGANAQACMAGYDRGPVFEGANSKVSTAYHGWLGRSDSIKKPLGGQRERERERKT